MRAAWACKPKRWNWQIFGHFSLQLNGVAHAARKLDATKEGANANRKNSEGAG